MLSKVSENPALIGEAMTKLRQTTSLILPFINQALEAVSQYEIEYAETRQALYEEQLGLGKPPTSAQVHAREMTRKLEAQVSVAKNDVYKLKNDYERFEEIVVALQSRIKEFASERYAEK